MGQLIYSAITSLDGYVADEDGNFDWAAPDEELHAYYNDLERPIGTHLYGRAMYEVMRFWATPEAVDDQPSVMRDYAEIWRAADKIVYSRTLPAAVTDRTRLERDFDPEQVRELVRSADRNVSIGGPHLAAAALRAGLVDEYHQFVTPVAVGGGIRAWPDGVRTRLELLGERRFADGVVQLHYRVAR